MRYLFRNLATEVRTVPASSHLMSERENTAERLVVIGRGRLLAEESAAEFATRGARTRTHATVRTPDVARIAAVLTAEDAEALAVTGTSPDRIGELAS
ncbi:hypothetical protein [Streptomyces sp. WELS2]|uniref:hypothetical protein n=1 Tax=Streptomyces sp. WELS2 TaxID=2749435 RepID=UPI0015F0A8CC